MTSRVLTALLVGLALLPAAVQGAAPPPPVADAHLAFTATMTGVPGGTFFRKTGSLQAGFGRLTSQALVNGANVDIDLVAALEYESGSGPFEGFITLRWAPQDTVAMEYVGGAIEDEAGSTTVTGTLHVIGGTGVYAGASGRGVVRGFRSGLLGGPVVYDFTLDLRTSAARALGHGRPFAAYDLDVRPGALKPLTRGRQNLTFETRLTWDADVLSAREIDAGGLLRYGGGRLTGVADLRRQPVDVELLAVYEYRDGEGPLEGFLYLTFADGLVICRYAGHVWSEGRDRSMLQAHLAVVLGTGAYAGVGGEGRMTGRGTRGVAGPINASLALVLR